MQFFKQTTKFDFMAKRRMFMWVSLAAVTLSVALVFTVQPKFGIDFMGGTEIQVQFKEKVNPSNVRKILEKIGFSGSEVVSFGAGESEYLIRLREISQITEKDQISSKAAFEKTFSKIKISKFEYSPGGDKLTIRTDSEISIADIEKAAAEAGVSLGIIIEAVSKNSTDTSAENKSDSKEANLQDGEDQATEENSSKRCESATCTWPYQNMRVYELSLKGVSDTVMDALRNESWGSGAIKMRSEWVGPKVGKQLRTAGVSSLVYALLFIMLYIAVRFDLRFAPGAVVALIHDVLITMGIFTIARIEVTLATVAALLTIVGYSLNDTIVVFDRIRENLQKIREKQLFNVINISINETLSRTILTSLTTLLVVIILLTIGWNTSLRDFAFALFIGIIIGTYSSIFVASPIVAWLDQFFAKKKA